MTPNQAAQQILQSLEDYLEPRPENEWEQERWITGRERAVTDLGDVFRWLRDFLK